MKTLFVFPLALMTSVTFGADKAETDKIPWNRPKAFGAKGVGGEPGVLPKGEAAAPVVAGERKKEKEGEKKTLKIGDAAPEFSLPGIDGEKHTLANYKDAKVLLIAFISNHCPTSQGAEARIKKLVEDNKDKGLQLVAINPNHPDALRPDELGYSILNDGFEDMQKHAKEQGFNFPYLYDGETQEVARAYGCLTTPHVFIFDAERKLRYKGAFDDSRFGDAATVKVHGARDAVEALLAGKEVPLSETKPHGCSTKWLTKMDEVTKDDEKWASAKVDVEFIDAAGVKKLRENGTKKVRLINVWATWCSSCVEEFPELAKTARKFGLRDFEFISISLDEPVDKEKVKTFLEKQQAAIPDKIRKTLTEEGRTTNSYIFKEPDGNQEPLVKALDPEGWEGLVAPHTILVAPDGEIIWRHNGEINGDELREKILAFMGRHYVP